MKTWQVIVGLIRANPWVYLLSVVLQIPRYLIILAPGIIIRELFDILTGVSQAGWSTWRLIALLVAAACSRLIMMVGTTYIDTTASAYGSTLVRANLFDRLLNRPDAQLLPFPPGDVANRLSSDTNAVTTYIYLSCLMSGTAVAALIAVSIMLTINPLLTLGALAPFVATGVVINRGSGHLQMYRRASRVADGNVSAFLGEFFNAVQAIQVATAETRLIERFRQLNQTRKRAALRERFFNDVITLSSLNFSVQLSTGVILLLAGQALRTDNFTVGDFALFVYFLGSVGEFIFQFGQNVATYKQTNIALERLLPLLYDAQPEALTAHRPVYLRGPFPEVPYITIVASLSI